MSIKIGIFYSSPENLQQAINYAKEISRETGWFIKDSKSMTSNITGYYIKNSFGDIIKTVEATDCGCCGERFNIVYIPITLANSSIEKELIKPRLTLYPGEFYYY